MLGVEIGDALRFELLALEFLPLMVEQIDAVGHIAGFRERIALTQQAGPALGGRTHVRERFAVTAVGIQQRQLAGAGEQGLMLVLAVDFDQQAGQFGQLRDSDRAAIDPGP